MIPARQDRDRSGTRSWAARARRAARGLGRGLRRHPIRTASALCLLAAGGYVAAAPHWTARQVALSTGPEPAPYSELFFTDISGLPTVSSPGEHDTVRFTIVNRQGRTFRYRYDVIVAGPHGRTLAGHGQVTVPDNRKAQLAARFRAGPPDTVYTVTVTISRPFDVIEFHGRTS